MKRSKAPVKWNQIPHEAIWRSIRASLDFGSIDQAANDAIRFTLRRRLSALDSSEHRRFTEIECTRIISALRLVRDRYSKHIAEIVGFHDPDQDEIVWTFAVVPRAVILLRSAAADYVLKSKITRERWLRLFSFSESRGPLYRVSATSPEPQVANASEVTETISNLITEESLKIVLLGGPFAREAQDRLLGIRMIFTQQDRERLQVDRQERYELWDASSVWMDGLSRLFDGTQEEILFQRDIWITRLRVVERIAELSPLHQTTYRHIVQAKLLTVRGSRSKIDWPTAFGELDEKGIKPGECLRGLERKVWLLATQKGLSSESWASCYASTKALHQDDGTSTTLRREVTNFMHRQAAAIVASMRRIS